MDTELDQRTAIGPQGSGNMSNGFDLNPERLQAVMAAFVAAHPGQTPTNITELLPSATTVEQKTALQKTIDIKNIEVLCYNASQPTPMPPRNQPPPDFSPWRMLGAILCFALVVFICVLVLKTTGEVRPLVFCALLVFLSTPLAILFVLSSSNFWSRPFTAFWSSFFYSSESITEPPKDLLFALRMRLRDRCWEAVDQQTRQLINAYGPSPELYHLRALMEGGRSGTHSATNVEAFKRLSSRAFDRYTALLRHDPPPIEIQNGIEA